MNFANVAAKDDKIFVTASSKSNGVFHHLYIYDIHKNCWQKLPLSGLRDGVPHIIGGKVVLIGGYLNSTGYKITNRVSTFNEENQTWVSYYPHMLSIRRQPGVVTHLEHVIVLGGTTDNAVLSSIEVLNWHENIQWKIASLTLPIPMWSFTPSTSSDQLIIVGFHGQGYRYNLPFMIPINDIIASVDQSADASLNWSEMEPTHPYFSVGTIPGSSPPVVVGGHDHSGKIATDSISLYHRSDNSWKKVAALSSARGRVAVATISNNAIIVIGGSTQGGRLNNALAHSLTLVELGQVEIKRPSIIDF